MTVAIGPPACVLFDLDGTLLDTAPDLAAAINQLRRERGVPDLPFELIRPTVSQGSPGMLKAGFGLEPEDPLYAELNRRFLELYRAAIAVETALFPGMTEVLAYLETHAIRWGVVTNKPGWLTEPLMKALNLWSRAACVVSGDTLSKRKPDPEPLWYACERAGATPARSVYVGDAERDVRAGNQAGMITLVAGFGYLSAEDRPEEWGAAGVLDQPADLLGWLDAALATDPE
ncbi:MAG: HAD-IA family hydrolase [Candidatus Competibacter sp.]|nr:HAD-IA family hydrolase [Candidatus Competibacter sp.]